MKTKSQPVSIPVLEEFRRDLRVLEREIVREMQAETECCGVTLAQCHVLLELARAGTLSLTELADTIGLDPSTLSRTVDGLVKADLISRAPDPADRRAVRLTCTPEGAGRVASINAACNRKYAALLTGVSRTRRAQILETVRFLANGIPRLRAAGVSGVACRTPGGGPRGEGTRAGRRGRQRNA